MIPHKNDYPSFIWSCGKIKIGDPRSIGFFDKTASGIQNLVHHPGIHQMTLASSRQWGHVFCATRFVGRRKATRMCGNLKSADFFRHYNRRHWTTSWQPHKHSVLSSLRGLVNSDLWSWQYQRSFVDFVIGIGTMDIRLVHHHMWHWNYRVTSLVTCVCDSIFEHYADLYILLYWLMAIIGSLYLLYDTVSMGLNQ